MSDTGHTVIGSEPAFPCDGPNAPAYGLTKREYFAAMAMQGLLASERADFAIKSETDLAECALANADALIATLSETHQS